MIQERGGRPRSPTRPLKCKHQDTRVEKLAQNWPEICRGRKEESQHKEKGKRKRGKKSQLFLFAYGAHGGWARCRKEARWSGSSDGQLAAIGRLLVSLSDAGFLFWRVKRRCFKCPSGLPSRFTLNAASPLGIGWQLSRLRLGVDVVVRLLPSTARSSSAALYIALLAKCSTHWRAFPQGGVRVR